MDEKIIYRTEFLDKLIAFKDKSLIKIITGIRRCGKSTLLQIYQDYLLKHGVDETQIISINFEDYDLKELRNPDNLYAYVKSKLNEKKTYIFFDEIQKVDKFPEIVDSLYIKPNVDLYITGSNSKLLSSEIATYISGRYVEIKMLPLSFKEFANGTKENSLPALYKQYIETSSFPYVTNLLNQPNEINDYLEGIYNTILVKDISERNSISDFMTLKSITRFVFDNIGSELSIKKISDTLSSSGRKVDSKTVEKYINALMESFIIYQSGRYNIKGKEYLKTLEKYYVVDIGLRSFLLGKKSMDVGHILENVIYLELLRRGYSVFVGKIDDNEIDFVAQNSDGNTYIQVASSVRDESTLERELRPLKKIKDSYPKLLLTLDEDPDCDYEGIKKLNALNWLMG